ncbi:chemotaxis protein MotB [Oikeobacillus pervagus]|uniref:Chemotaxis protein MotB n=1 Tax=Oikeobacillus pervagus TaxID=1325931 RepID=A0AAJ1T4F4_9BACI|nr:flagellar motor protein MotS [Oikeobacillus pervagus]MDQ0215031.1 chemotaxis protein MotB [Oikeobacillus pervagus]
MNMRRRPPEKPNGAPKWMVTFADLVTLVLVFFILLFSMSQIDQLKFKTMIESFKDKPIMEFYPSIIPADEPSSLPKPIKKEEDGQGSLDKLLNEVQASLKEYGLEEVATATRTERGVVLVLQEQILFDTAKATVVEEAYPFLKQLGKMLAGKPNIVKIEGHTDNRPIKNDQFPSNWELSSARSSSVIRFLVENENLDPSRFIAVGYGSTRPVVPNDSEENFQKNRRVEVIISDPKYDDNDAESTMK